jgi:membrane dipeptidase
MAFSREVSEEAGRIHHDSIVIDGCSFFCEGHNETLAESGITALNITVPFPSDERGEALRRIADYYHVINNDPRLVLIESVEDIYLAKNESAVGIIIAAQNSAQFEHDFLDGMVEAFYRLGVRVAVLAYNNRNFAADGCIAGTGAGLSREGRRLIYEMNRCGIVIDCSHTGERSSLEAIELSEKPCIFSHSNPKAKSNMPRNITDEQITRVAGRGGVVGLTTFPPMNWDGGDVAPGLDDFLDNIEYVIDLVGVDHVGIGTDKEATPGAYPRELILRELPGLSVSVGDYYVHFAGHPEAIALDGFSDQSCFPLITQGLLDRGYDEESIRKVLGLNFARVFEEVWT